MSITITTIPRRHTPVVTQLDVLLPEVEALAAACSDNAHEGEPLPFSVVREWQRQLQRINRYLEEAI